VPSIPSPPQHFLIGHLPEIRADMPGFLLSTAREYGPVSRFKMGPVPMFLISDAHLVHEMLVKRPAEFRKSARTTQVISGHLGDGLLTREGADHRRHRRLMQPTLHTQRIAGYGDIMVAEALRRAASWDDDAEIELVSEMSDLTLRIVGASLFSVDEHAQLLLDAVHDFALSLNAYLMGLAGILPDWLPTKVNRWKRRSVARVDLLAYNLIRERREHGGGDLLSMLIEARDAEGGAQLADREIRDELMTMFFAGHETSATALTWAFYELARNPRVLDALRDELAGVIGDRFPSLAGLGSLPYLRSVVQETLRRWPPGWLFDRTPIAPTTVGGYEFTPGQILYFSPYVIHLDPQWWDAPLSFQPSRFSSDVPREAYLPFGDGPRMCVGNRFAEAEIALVLAVLVPRVSLSLVSDVPVVAEGQTTLRPKGGLRMKVSRR
jgi:cytochrome P450